MTTEVLNTPAAAAAVPPALADGATAPAALLQGAFLTFRVAEAGTSLLALPPYMMFSPVQRFAGVVSPGLPVAGGGMRHGCVGLCAPSPVKPSEFYHGSQAKMINTRLLPSGWCQLEEYHTWGQRRRRKEIFFFPRMIYHQLFKSAQMSATLEAVLRKSNLFI